MTESKKKVIIELFKGKNVKKPRFFYTKCSFYTPFFVIISVFCNQKTKLS